MHQFGTKLCVICWQSMQMPFQRRTASLFDGCQKKINYSKISVFLMGDGKTVTILHVCRRCRKKLHDAYSYIFTPCILPSSTTFALVFRFPFIHGSKYPMYRRPLRVTLDNAATIIAMNKKIDGSFFLIFQRGRSKYISEHGHLHLYTYIQRVTFL